MPLYVYQGTYTAESLAVAAAGGVDAVSITRLLNGQEWVESLRKAQAAAYRPAR